MMALQRALRRMAGLVFLLILWVLAGGRLPKARRGRVFIERRSRVHVAVWAHGEKLHILLDRF